MAFSQNPIHSVLVEQQQHQQKQVEEPLDQVKDILPLRQAKIKPEHRRLSLYYFHSLSMAST